MSLKDYIQGNRHGKEANRLEREAMNDPFLQGALDGFDSVDGDHSKIIEQLEKKISHPSEVTQSKKRKFLYWVAAASILLLIGFGAYFFHISNNSKAVLIADVQQNKNENIILTDSSTLRAKNNEDKKIISAPQSLTNIPAKNENITINDVDIAENKSALKQTDTIEKPMLAESKAEKTATQIIQGKVVDENGEPLAGVSIVKKGTSTETVTDANGNFTFQLQVADSLQLIASYIGFESQQINLSEKNKIFALKPDEKSLSEVVVIGYGTQRKSATTGAVSHVLEEKKDKADINRSIQSNFGEKEFQAWCQQRADKNICEGKGATVKVSFFIDETGKPSNIKYKKYSCENAREEIKKLLSSSPVWTEVNRKITMTVKW